MMIHSKASHLLSLFKSRSNLFKGYCADVVLATAVISRRKFSSSGGELSSTTTSSFKGIGVLGLCEDRNSSYKRGSRHAPPIILETFRCDSSNTYSELGVDIQPYLTHIGDWHPSNDSAQSSTLVPPLTALLQTIHTQGLLPLILGGDHSLSYPIVQALHQLHSSTRQSEEPEPFVIVHFDAHPDLYPLFQENPSSHASPFARILEHTSPSPLCSQLIQIGIRTINDIQRMQIEKYNVKTIEARHFPANGSEIASILKPLIPSKDTPVYVTFDMDCIDPGMAPGVSHRESGGLTVRQAVDAIHAIPGRIVGADLVEYNPERDIDNITAEVASKLLKEIAGKMLISNSVVNL